MFMLNEKHIIDKLHISGASAFVILNGIYQPQLSLLLPNSDRIILERGVLKIPKDTTISSYIHLLFLSSKNYQGSFEIVAEENSYVILVEEHVSLESGDNSYTGEIKLNITAKKNSSISYNKLQLEDNIRSNYQETININQETESKIRNHFFIKGTKTAKYTLNVKLNGENSSYNMGNANILCNDQNISNQICIEHLKPNCTSNVLSKSIIDDQATNNFNCRVIAYKNATKTETHVINKNILLSKSATANSSPELEIYADDVVCTHGATVGQMDEEALFYLCSRGVKKSEAITMLLSLFIKEITGRFVQCKRITNILSLP